MSQRLTDAALGELVKTRGFEGERSGSAIAAIIAALVPVVVDLIKDCSADDEKAAGVARRPNLIQRFRLRRELKRLVPDDDDDSKEVREAVFNSVLAAGKTAAAADFASVGSAA